MVGFIKKLSAKWREYRIARAEKVLENTGAYEELRGRIVGLEAVNKTLEGNYLKAVEERAEQGSAYKAKILEREKRVSLLEEELYLAGKNLEEISSRNAELEDSFKSSNSRAESLNAEKLKLERALNLAKKFAVDYRGRIIAWEKYAAELNVYIDGLEKNLSDSDGSRTRDIEFRLEAEHRKAVLEYRKGLADLANSYGALVKDILEGTNERAQVQNKFLRAMLKFFAREDSIDKRVCLLLDSNYKPAFATQGFYKFFGLQQDSDVSNYPLQEEIINQSKDRPKSVVRKQFSGSWNIATKLANLDLDMRFVESSKGLPLGVVIEYRSHQGIFGKIFHGKGAVERLDKHIESQKPNQTDLSEEESFDSEENQS